jgi:hypothetical protein
VSDHIDAIAHLQRAARPSRHVPANNGALRPKAPTPLLPTPAIARPTVWAASQMSYEEVLDAVRDLELANGTTSPKQIRSRVLSAETLLGWLLRFPGESWQQRWHASGANPARKDWTTLAAEPDKHGHLIAAVGRLLLIDVIRPDYAWLYATHATPRLYERLRALRDPAGFATIERLCDADARILPSDRRYALNQLTRILVHNGGTLVDITLPDCIEAHRAQDGYCKRSHPRWYTLLRDAAILPATSPPTVIAASRRGQLTIEEMVDRYDVVCRPVRDLFVAYLYERRPAMDYNSIRYLASKLVLLFWRDLELHEPGIDSLHLSDEVARRWKTRLNGPVLYGSNRVGKTREDPYTILMAVRAFYADLSHWALEDPARWAAWAAPSPVDSRDLAGMTKMLKHSRSRTHQRIRELAPLLPRLVDAAHDNRAATRELLGFAVATPPGESFTAAGQTLRRASLSDNVRSGNRGSRGHVYVDTPPRPGGSERPQDNRRNLSLEADRAFWAWALVEVLRHTGARIEEVLEITHRSFVSYRLPSSGEVIPMLQITPSKTDKERLVVIGPELAVAFAEIISHVRGDNEQLPLVSRYDNAERVHSPELPFLFQRPWGTGRNTISSSYVIKLLDELVAIAKITNSDGTPAKFGPHDFRRIFATEAVASGLPVHITAKILGHDSIATTQTYVAVYDQDVIEHHRAYIARRRSLRPSQEYREPTESEWDEFLGHFAQRKLELGTCGRSYGSGCQHEHACIRCPMLRPDPDQHERLQGIIGSLEVRIAEANQRGWLGEVDGLRVSLAAAEQKLTQMQRTATNLGMPIFPRRPREPRRPSTSR